jgi:hypothetical protein
MPDVAVPRRAVERHAAWIAAVEMAVAGLDDPAEVMEILGIDIDQTVRNPGLPCQPLQTRDQIPNRCGFLRID